MPALLAAALVITLGLLAAVVRGTGGQRAVRRRLRAESVVDPMARLTAWWAARPGPSERALVAGLPAALDTVARSVRSGASLRTALAGAGAGPAGNALAHLAEASARGRPLADACEGWADTSAAAEVRLVGHALALAATAGGTPARAIDAVTASLRERQTLAHEVQAQSAQARLSALVIGLLPLAFTGWCLLTDPRIAGFLLTSRAGWACLASGLGLDAIGLVWMNRLVRRAAA